MTKPNQVPKFGNWDTNEQLPFTVVFEKARADRVTGNKIIDPSANPTAFGIRTDGPIPSRRTSQQYADELRVRVDSGRGRLNGKGGPLRPTAITDRSKWGSPGSTQESEGVGFGEAHNQSAEQSPIHSPSAFKRRLGDRPVSSSLVPEKKGPPEGGTPARTRLRPGSRGEETADRSSALPRFGAWDEKDPSSGEAFTVIFSHARNERKVGGPVRIPTLESESPSTTKVVDCGDAYKPQHFPLQRKASSWVCCFQARDAV